MLQLDEVDSSSWWRPAHQHPVARSKCGHLQPWLQWQKFIKSMFVSYGLAQADLQERGVAFSFSDNWSAKPKKSKLKRLIASSHPHDDSGLITITELYHGLHTDQSDFSNLHAFRTCRITLQCPRGAISVISISSPNPE